jgi:NAD(P)-dependent dehydrogenase (short-subunit alcohol dehydrogenase family)
MDLKLKGRTVLITGGSKGIGFGVARWFASEGCNLRLAARSQDDLDKAKAKIAQIAPVDVRTYALDLSKSEARAQLVEACKDVDILINNAGGVPGGSIEDIDDAKWRASWELKVFGYINMSRAFYSLMKARRRGVIINIIGIGGERLDSGYIAGATGNAALMAFSRALGSTSIDEGVRVLAVNPGPVETERLEFLGRKRAQDRLGDPERWREFFKNMPLGRAATVDETAASVVFLASDLSSYTSGVVFTIDGGLVSRGALP